MTRWGRGAAGRTGGRPFEKGDLKYVFLDLLRERPRHGYDLIRALEERFQGAYSASPGAVYPILQMLEDMGHVTSQVQDGRRVYTLTPAGRQFLEGREAQVQEIWTRARGACCAGGQSDEWQGALAELKGLFELLAHDRRGRALDPGAAARVREALVEVRARIEGILTQPD